jgi:valyl-tRNA synthetase
LARLQSELNETQSQIERLEKLLNSPFAEKAPAQVVANEREKLEKYISTAENLKNQIAGM